MMSGKDNLFDKWAESYDSESVKVQWHGPAMIFGLMYPYVMAGQTLLDLGIGTGLGAMPFHKAGLKISGIDSSPTMLEQCRKKDLGFDLVLHDLEQTPWPFKENTYNHIISTGVFHSLGDLRDIIGEAARVLKTSGMFAFDYFEYFPDADDDFELYKDGIYTRYNTEYNHKIYKHTEDYISGLLTENNFEILHDAEFLASGKLKKYFRVYVSKLK
ncbi:MAG TPA: class I SAM-dependent methyltransferase [candidate division Zixibacteria bacterium]|nr:class I SAM-dependent methyltransferase [candidate division Zixibacteria bacterium]